MPVSALCDLLGTLRRSGRKVFVVHDFDKSGFSIVSTLRRGTRGSWGTGDVVDLGFRLEDIQGLEREPVTYRGDPRPNLRQNGATKEEIGILVQSSGHGQYYGERVELNAMTSEQFIEWLERKLTEAGIEKLIPENETLVAAYRRAVFLQRMKEEQDKVREQILRQSIEVPDSLANQVRDEINDSPELAWDEVVWRIAANGTEADCD